MIEGLWSVVFKSNLGIIGSGVAVFETGRVFGGDSAFIFVGKYTVNQGVVQAQVSITKYSDIANMRSIFGNRSNFNVNVSGRIDPENPKHLEITGYLVEDKNMRLTIIATRQVDLP